MTRFAKFMTQGPFDLKLSGALLVIQRTWINSLNKNCSSSVEASPRFSKYKTWCRGGVLVLLLIGKGWQKFNTCENWKLLFVSGRGGGVNDQKVIFFYPEKMSCLIGHLARKQCIIRRSVNMGVGGFNSDLANTL